MVESTAIVRGEIQKVILYLISLSTGCLCEGNTVESVNYPLVLLQLTMGTLFSYIREILI